MTRLRIYGAQFVLGLVLALTLWTYVSFTTNPNSTRMITTPVRVVGLQPGLTIVNTGTGIPESKEISTTLTISGPEDDIGDLTSADFEASLNLDAVGPGVADVPINVEGPDAVRVRSKSPSQVTLRLARELTATVPITIDVQGQAPFSVDVGELTQGAQEAVVRGPEDLVQRVVAARAEVNLQGQTVDLETTLELQPVDAAGDPVEGVTVEPERVAVRVPIVAQFDDVQQVSVVPALDGQPAPGYAVGAINWHPKIVQVIAPDIVTGTVSTEKIDLTGRSSGITTTVGLQGLPNVITRPEDLEVMVSVEIVPIVVPSQLPLLVPVSPINLGEGLSAPAAEPASVQITLAGPFEQLSQLANTPGVVTATVDLQGLGPGTYNLPVEIQAPPGLRIVSPGTSIVSVTIDPLPTPTPEPSPSPVTTPESTPGVTAEPTPTSPPP